jgi:hypothetical protein
MIACSPAPASPTVTLPPPIVTIIRPTEIPITETPTVLPSPTALPHLMYPYTIAGLRERTFTGGEISLDVVLGLTDTYTRYLISYPSDGLRITGILQIPAGQGPFPVIVMNHGFAARSRLHLRQWHRPRSRISRGARLHHHRIRLSHLGRLRHQSLFLSHRPGHRRDESDRISAIHPAGRCFAHRHVGTQHGRRHYYEDTYDSRWSRN